MQSRFTLRSSLEKGLRWLLLCAAIGMGAACTTTAGDSSLPALRSAAWEAPLPHAGDPLQVARWWERLGDADLVWLVDEAQRSSPAMEVAIARVEQGRAMAARAGTGDFPTLNGRAGAQRASSIFPMPILMNQLTGALDAAWELDLFGHTRHARRAAEARARGALAGWHDARVTLSADVASAFVNLRTQQALLRVMDEDLVSQKRSLDLTQRKVKAGLAPPADTSLITARSADGSMRARAQRAQVDLAYKAVVALTDIPEGQLRERLEPNAGAIPEPGALSIATVPAQALAQRPDLAAIEQEIAALAHEVGGARAERYPRISLAGSIGYMSVRSSALNNSGRVWNIGPSISFPVFNRGFSAGVDLAEAQLEEQKASYRQRALMAVREAEESLVRLSAANDRIGDAQSAARASNDYFKASSSMYEHGSGTLFEREEARRNGLGAQAALLQVQADRLLAWIALYKAMGGGWQVEAVEPAMKRQ